MMALKLNASERLSQLERIRQMTKNIDDLMAATRQTAVYQEGIQKLLLDEEDELDAAEILNLNYCILGLCGEAGEMANKFKKFFRGDMSFSEVKEAVAAENRDVLWYLLRVFDELELEPSDEAYKLLTKLKDRSERGVVKGSGDER